MAWTAGVGVGAPDWAKAAIARPKVPTATMALNRIRIDRPPKTADHGIGGLNDW
jgi:hypothetical protein